MYKNMTMTKLTETLNLPHATIFDGLCPKTNLCAECCRYV